MSDEFSVQKELAEANARLPVNLGDTPMPLDINIRSIALTIAQRHCGDTTVKEGNLYQQLKMDNKLAGPLTVEHVIHCALIFERFLWGEWSKGLAAQAMEETMGKVEEVLKREADKHIKGLEDEPPIRPHSGGES